MEQLMYQAHQLAALTRKLASTEPRLSEIQVEYDAACMAYRIRFIFGSQFVVVMIPTIELYMADTERVFIDALHDSVNALDEFDVIDVDFRIERKALPGPPVLQLR
jgi:CRISPR/Cas system endoribonuclease Cas6 (RAMP superfamily)